MRQEAESDSRDVTTALLQVDFSENYSCMSQDEVQSAHWNQRQVSLFTAALWHSGFLHSRVIASDNLVHSKDTILAYLDMLLDELPDSVRSLFIWFDGPASQFKNRYIASGIAALQEKHKVDVHWNFFCTSHGKGPVDGIGGSVKRYVRNKVSARQCLVKDATTFVAAAAGMSKVVVKEMTSSKLADRNKALNTDLVFAKASAITGISKVHYMHVVHGNVVPHILTKDGISGNLDGVHCNKSPRDPGNDKSIEVGDWYIVDYEGRRFPGEVVVVGDGKLSVSDGTGRKILEVAFSKGCHLLHEGEDDFKIGFSRDC